MSASSKPIGRARSLQELAAIPPLASKEGVAKGMEIQFRPSDVVITPFGKSGTPWTRRIVHTLRTDGDMDFDDISRVVPWIEVSTDLGIDLNAEQRANPRAFKSHLSWDRIPKGAKYINIVRDPADAAMSAFRFQEGWFIEPGCIDVDEFMTERFLKKREYYAHLRSWWAHKDDDNVLFLAYEQMLTDPEKTVRRIAEFCEIELTEERLALTLEHSSIEFMLAHKDRFDDALLRRRSEIVCGIPPGSDSAKVVQGKKGAGQQLSTATLTAFAAAWREEIEEQLGYETYADLIAAL